MCSCRLCSIKSLASAIRLNPFHKWFALTLCIYSTVFSVCATVPANALTLEACIDNKSTNMSYFHTYVLTANVPSTNAYKFRANVPYTFQLCLHTGYTAPPFRNDAPLARTQPFACCTSGSVPVTQPSVHLLDQCWAPCFSNGSTRPQVHRFLPSTPCHSSLNSGHYHVRPLVQQLAQPSTQPLAQPLPQHWAHLRPTTLTHRLPTPPPLLTLTQLHRVFRTKQGNRGSSQTSQHFDDSNDSHSPFPFFLWLVIDKPYKPTFFGHSRSTAAAPRLPSKNLSHSLPGSFPAPNPAVPSQSPCLPTPTLHQQWSLH